MAWYNRGVAYSSLGRRQEAIDSYDEALRLDPGYAAAWNNKGIALSALGRHEEAIACYEKALEAGVGESDAGNETEAAFEVDLALSNETEAAELQSPAEESEPAHPPIGNGTVETEA